MIKQDVKMIATALLCATALTPAYAGNKTWTGTIDSNWSTSGNWSASGEPATGDAVTVDGTNTAIIDTVSAVSNTITVGKNTTGTLTILNGGALATSNTTSSAWLGFNAGSVGSITVTGSGSTWLNGGLLTVGRAGDGFLTISNSGAVTSTSTLYAGSTSGASGTLLISNGGTASSGANASGIAGSIANLAGSTGTATVDGAGSLWSNNGNLFVGNYGDGSLTVSNGGQVTNAVGYIGYNAGSSGIVTVDGAGSQWNSSGTLNVGNSGSGDLTITAGGRVSSAKGLIATNAGSAGTATVSGGGSRWDSVGSLTIGNTSTGSLSILDGAQVTAGVGAIGQRSGATGTVLISGTSSSWNIGDLYFGFNTLTDPNNLTGGTGSVTIQNRGVLATSSGLAYAFSTGNYTSTSTIYLGYTVGADSSLNIGAKQGDAAQTPGTLVADNIVFGAGSGTLNFNHTDSGYLFSTAISGTGTINALAGTTILTGDSSGFTGNTSVASGATLQIGNANNSGSLGGTIADNGILLFDRSDDLAYSGVISGTGILVKDGAGVLNLTGDSSAFSGTTTVSAGELKVNGSLAGSATTVNSGASLSGAGSVGALTVETGGAIAPGNSPGTLTVNGNYTALSGSTYSAELVSGSTTSDRIAVNGTATIQSGAVLQAINASATSLTPNTRYTILTATGGIVGTYTLAGSIATSAFYSLRDSYDANNVYIDVTQTRAFADAAETRNEMAVASGLQSLPVGSLLRGTIESIPDDATARVAFNQLSGEIHSSAAGVAASNTAVTRSAVLDRLRAAFDDTPLPDRTCAVGSYSLTDCPTLWTQGLGAWGMNGGNGNAQRLETATGGVIAGIDAPGLDNSRFGVFLSYQNTAVNGSGDASGSISTPAIGAYSGTNWGHLSMRGGASLAWSDIAIKRAVSYTGYSDVLKSQYNGASTQAFGEIGYRIDLPSSGNIRSASLEPFSGLAGVVSYTDEFIEQGGAAALTGTKHDTAMALSTFGLRGKAAIEFWGMEVGTTATFGWRHVFGDITSQTTMAFTGSVPFTVDGTPLDHDMFFGTIGLSAKTSPKSTLAVSYNGEIGQRTHSQGLHGNFSVSF